MVDPHSGSLPLQTGDPWSDPHLRAEGVRDGNHRGAGDPRTPRWAHPWGAGVPSRRGVGREVLAFREEGLEDPTTLASGLERTEHTVTHIRTLYTVHAGGEPLTKLLSHTHIYILISA